MLLHRLPHSHISYKTVMSKIQWYIKKGMPVRERGFLHHKGKFRSFGSVYSFENPWICLSRFGFTNRIFDNAFGAESSTSARNRIHQVINIVIITKYTLKTNSHILNIFDTPDIFFNFFNSFNFSNLLIQQCWNAAYMQRILRLYCTPTSDMVK